jgi:hypothetical protein
MSESEISFDPELKATHQKPVYNKQLITDYKLDPVTNQPIPTLGHERDSNYERNLLKPTTSEK